MGLPYSSPSRILTSSAFHCWCTALYSVVNFVSVVLHARCNTKSILIFSLRVCWISGETRMLPDSLLSGNIQNYRVPSCRIRIIPDSHVHIVLVNPAFSGTVLLTNYLIQTTAVTSLVTCEWPCRTKHALMCEWVRDENSFIMRPQHTPAHTSTCVHACSLAT